MGCSIPLRLLLIEDDANDALLIERELRRSGYAVTPERVQTAAELEVALDGQWDVVTCDWVMPAFSAPEALSILAAHGVDAPVIIVSGQAAEEVTVTAMKAGAHDVVSKNNLTRLGPAVERELREVEARRALRRAEDALRASEMRYRRLFETARDGIFILDGESGRIIDVNPYLVEVLGYSRDQLVGRQLWELGPFLDIARSREAFRDLQRRDYIRYEHLPLESRDGRHTDVEFVSNAYDVDGERVIQCNVRNITGRKQAERASQLLNGDLERRVLRLTAQADALRKELAAVGDSMSRDLLAPLRRIEEAAQRLLESPSPHLEQERRDFVDRVQADAERMARLLGELIDRARGAEI